jgi:peptide/nickel transport system substrate-binding protein
VDDYAYHLYQELRAERITRRQLLQRAATMGVSAAATSAIVAACASSAAKSPATAGSRKSGVPRHGGILQIGTIGAGGALEPWVSYNSGAVIAFQFAAEYLCTRNSAEQLVPQLATSWAPVGGNTKEWRFTLRRGVTFQDGKPFSAADVVATFDRIANPKFSSGALSALQGILSSGGTEEVDPYTVVFHLDRPFADFPYLVTPATYNAVILPKSYRLGTFVNGRAGTGPFIMTSYRPEVGATFIRNPRYWDHPKPYLNGAHMTFYADASPAFLALQAGSIDVFDSMPFTGSQPIFANRSLKVLSQKAQTWRAIHMRVTDKPWTDPRVRQALAYTLDRAGAVAALFSGHAEIGNDHAFAPIYNTTPSTTALPQREQDLSKAKSLLAQAGYPHGFRATLTSENFLEIPSLLTLLKADAAKAGIDITLKIETQTTYYGSGSNQPWLDVPFGCVDWDTRPAAGQNSEPAFACGGVWNSAHWCSPRWTAIMREYDAEADLQRRRSLALQACRIQQAATPAVIPYWINNLTGAKKTVQGYDTGARYFAGVWLS